MKRPLSSFLFGALLVSLLAGAAVAGEFQRSFALDSRELKVSNLIGAVEVLPSADGEFHVDVRVQGEDASEDLLEFEVREGRKGELLVRFPVKGHSKYVYPPLGRNSKTVFTRRDVQAEERSWLKKLFSGWSGRKITVRGKGGGLEVWADLVIRVPEGRSLALDQGLGRIVARDVAADLSLDINSGSIETRDTSGDLVADTGSGDVEVLRARGEVLVDTGSGNVTVTDIDGAKLLVDTGSGNVEVAEARCRSLNVDTGSGRVTARRVHTDAAHIDTGSGHVQLQLDHMGQGRYLVDTGSGNITLELPADASARILADTGSGGITSLIEGATINHKERDELDMTVGGGKNRVVLDAGSGSITIK